MSNLLFYIISTGVCLGLFVSAYQLFLRNNTRFNLCRTYLIAAILLSFLIPSLPIDLGIKPLFTKETVRTMQPRIDFADQVQVEAIEAEPILNTDKNWDIDPVQTIGIALIAISLLLLVRFAYRFGSIILIQISGNRLENEDGVNLIFTDKTDNAFSFLGNIFINPLKFNDEEKRLIIEHEREHIRHFHSVDLIIVELLIVFQWFNPFAYIARRKLIEIHEFIADNGVIQKGADPYSYQNLLLSVVTSSCLPSAGNQLSAFITKKRIAMIGKPMTQTGKRVNFLILIPVAAILIVGISAFSPIKYINNLQDKTYKKELLARAEKEGIKNALQDIYFELNPNEYQEKNTITLKGGYDYIFNFITKTKEERIDAYISSIDKETPTKYVVLFSYSTERIVTINKTSEFSIRVGNRSDHSKVEMLALIRLKGIHDPKNDTYDKPVVQNDTTLLGRIDEEIGKLQERSWQDIDVNKGGILNHFYVDLTTKNSNTYSVNLKKDQPYKIYYYSMSSKDKLLAKIESGESKKLITEKSMNFSYADQIKFTPKTTATYLLTIENQSAIKTNAYIVLTLEDSKEIVQEKIPERPKVDTLKDKIVKKTSLESSEDEVFTVVEQMPTFGSGVPNSNEFRAWVAANMKYPKEAAEKGIEGRVFVQFIVSKDGNIKSPKIIRGVDPLLDAEALRVVSLSPKWNPGMQRGKNVDVFFTFPITFVLDGKEKTKQVQALPKIDTLKRYQLTMRAANEVKDVYLKDFYTELAPNGNQNYSLILKKECSYAFNLFTSNPDDKISFMLGIRNEGETLTEIIGEYRDGSKIKVTPKKTGAYNISLTNLTSKNTSVLLYLSFTGMVSSEPIPTNPPNSEITIDIDNETFLVVEQMPTFGGGDPNEFRAYIAANIQYPKEAAEKGIQGRVFVQYIIEKDGSVTNVKILRGVDPSLDKEAIRVVESSPKWNPGMQKGKPVRVSFTSPITFSLK